MHLCSLCCAPRCCARNGWTESHDHFPDSANAPAILPNESYNFNNSLSRIPNSKKKSFLFSHLFAKFFNLRKNSQSPNLPFILSRFNDLHSINETWIVVEIFFIDPGRRRAREEDPSRRLVIQPAATRCSAYPRRKRKKQFCNRGEERERRDRNREKADRPRHRRRISTELEFKSARPVGDVTQYLRFRRTRIAANDVNAPSSSPLVVVVVVARNVLPVALSSSSSSCFSGDTGTGRFAAISKGIVEDKGFEFRGNLWGGLILVIPGVY